MERVRLLCEVDPKIEKQEHAQEQDENSNDDNNMYMCYALSCLPHLAKRNLVILEKDTLLSYLGLYAICQ